MSLPLPRTDGAMFSPEELKDMEGPLIALAQKSGGNLRKLLSAFFGFLHQRTDFYILNDNDSNMGFQEGEAEKLLLACFRQYPLRRLKPKTPAMPTDTKKDNAPAKLESQRDQVEEERGKTDEKKKTAQIATEEMSDIRRTEEGKQIPVGNGGTTARYKWTQTIDETSVLLSVPEGVRGKDIDVHWTSTFVSVKLKYPLVLDNSHEPQNLLEGKFVEQINKSESTWSLEGGVLVLTLEKVKKTWWKTVLEGDDEIDASLVDSRRKIGEYDEATQAAIRKIIYDQNQERKGLPPSTAPVPILPSGVEYIDKKTLDKSDEKQTK